MTGGYVCIDLHGLSIILYDTCVLCCMFGVRQGHKTANIVGGYIDMADA